MLGPASAIVGVGWRVERRARRTAGALARGIAEQAVDLALRSPLVEIVARNVVRHRVIQRAAAPVAADRALEEIVAAAVDTPAARRMVADVIESGLVDEAVARLLESEDLWVLVDEIARSPAVTDAIGRQGAGLAEQVAEELRVRSRSADARLERAAHRVLRRGEPAPARASDAQPRAGAG